MKKDLSRRSSIHRYLGWAALSIAPVLLGARGCDVVGAGSECGGLRGTECGAGEFCSYPPEAACGAADRTGTCEALPDACGEIFAPVCGCDDRTYSNACEANAAGVSVARAGACEASAEASCGGLLGARCGAGEFCSFAPDAQCGAADQTGTCARIPDACTQQYDPVCGCDGVTYGNACSASAAGVSVASTGECP